MSIESIKEEIDLRRVRLESAANELIDFFEKAEKQRKVPIYDQKFRIKEPESAFLKTKIKCKDSIEDFTDLAGVRVLCLCEQDLLAAHKDFIHQLPDGFGITEFTLFNWSMYSEDRVDRVFDTQTIYKRTRMCSVRRLRSDSGYKSLHYLIEFQNGEIVEVQFRTLIQNVWSELEHKLAYKSDGRNPQIELSFRSIASHLEAIESVVSDIKNISDRESISSKEFRKRHGPLVVFFHSVPSLDEIYRDELYEKYENHLELRASTKPSDFGAWREDGKTLFNEIARRISNEYPSSQFWKAWESVFWKFCDGEDDYQAALEGYQRILKDSEYKDNEEIHRFKTDEYLIHFRIGELYFIRGELPLAFESFDRCVSQMPESSESEFENMYKVAVLLAYFYWVFNRSCSHISLEYMRAAEKWANEDDPAQTSKYLNGTLWYLLEIYWETKKRPSSDSASNDRSEQTLQLKEIADLYEALKSYVEEMDPKFLNNNLYHTLACVAYELDLAVQEGLIEMEGDLFQDSVIFCDLVLNHRNGNVAYNLDLSYSLQKQSIENILVEDVRRNR